MISLRLSSAALVLLAATIPFSFAETPADHPVPVTVDNYNRTESDVSFAGVVKMGGFGKFSHLREPTPINKQTIIRPNRDTLYSTAVFDLEAGPVTITLPNAGKRYMALQIIDEDQYAPAVY